MGILIIILAGFFYLLPSLVALNNKKSNSGAIFALNLLLGWSFIGWVVAFIWAITKDRQPDIVQIFEKNHPHTLGYVKK